MPWLGRACFAVAAAPAPPGRPTPCPVPLSVLAGSFAWLVQIDVFLLSLSFDLLVQATGAKYIDLFRDWFIATARWDLVVCKALGPEYAVVTP